MRKARNIKAWAGDLQATYGRFGHLYRSATFHLTQRSIPPMLHRNKPSTHDLLSMEANMAKATTKAAAASVEEFAADAQKTMTDGMEKMTKGIEEMTSFSQDNMDAVVKSSEIAAKAAEGIGSEVTAYSKKAFEDGVAAAQDLASAKNLTELMEKQTAFAQSAFEGFMSQATKMNEIYMAAAKEITAPLNKRVTAATESMKSFGA
ncbi:MAG: TIGR01841 family phasin [Pseudomonadota bacterium]